MPTASPTTSRSPSTPPGQPVRAWLNEGREAQSYRYRADRIEPYLRPQRRDGPRTTWPRRPISSTSGPAPRPYDYWTADGRFFDRVYTRDAWGTHFAWIREYLGGNAPQISESGHDQLIGWLDGAQTNHLRVGKPLPGGTRLVRVEHRAAPTPSAPPGSTPPITTASCCTGPAIRAATRADSTRACTASTATTTWPPRCSPAIRPWCPRRSAATWCASIGCWPDLGRALALRTIEHVEFVGGDLHRQHVVWSGVQGDRFMFSDNAAHGAVADSPKNGPVPDLRADVWVNRGEEDWSVAGTVLPPYGFLARATSATAR